MLAGIDDIDWESMQHAYGTAEEVPAMLRGLLDVDDAVRADAEEGLWGAVHHQGDVYDSTLATIPFLVEIASRPGPSQRTALDLLGSYGGVDVSSLLERGEAVPWHRPGDAYEQAEAQVAAARSTFLGQFASPEPHVRESAVVASLVGTPDGLVAQRLLDLFAHEENTQTRTTVQAALGWLSRQGLPELNDWVREQEQSADPNVRVNALIEAARNGKTIDISGLVSTIGAVYDQHGPPEVVSLRARLSRKAPPRRRRAEDEKRVIARLSEALPDPAPLLAELLISQDWEIAVDAITPASEHIRKVRGHHAPLVSLIASKFHDAPHEVGRALMVAGPLARPAQQELVNAPVDENVLAALINLQDPHAVPHLRAELRRRQPGRNVGFQIARLGAVAAPLADDILRALRHRGEATNGLLQAATRLEIAAAVPIAERLLPDEFAIRALRLFGRSAQQATPQLEGLLNSEPKIAVAAAHALWSVDSNLEGLAIILRELDTPTNGFTFRAAAEAAGEMGALEATPALLAGLASDDPHGWPQLASAQALWRLEPSSSAIDRIGTTLRACWARNESIRLDVAKLLVAMGESGRALLDLVQEEAENPLRLTSRGGGWSTDDVARDEELLATLRKLTHGSTD